MCNLTWRIRQARRPLLTTHYSLISTHNNLTHYYRQVSFCSGFMLELHCLAWYVRIES